MSTINRKCECKVSCQLTKQLKCSSADANNNGQDISDISDKNVSIKTIKKFDENIIYSIPIKRPISTNIKHISTNINSSKNYFSTDQWSDKWPRVTMAYTYVIKTGKYIRREIPYEICCYIISVAMIVTMVSLPLSEQCLSSSNNRVQKDDNLLINNLKLSNHSSTSHYHVISLDGKEDKVNVSKPSASGLNASASDHDFTATLINPPPSVNHIPREESSTLMVRDYLKVTKKSVGTIGHGHHPTRYDSNVDNSLAKGPLANPATLMNRIYPFYPHPFIQRSSAQPVDARPLVPPPARPEHGISYSDNKYSDNEIRNGDRFDDQSNYYQPSVKNNRVSLPPDELPPPPPTFVPSIVYGRHAKNGDKVTAISNNNIASESNGDYVSLPIPDHLKNATLDWFKKMTNGNAPISDLNNLPSKYTISGGRIEYKHDPGSVPIENRYDFGPIEDSDIPSGYVRNGRMITNHNIGNIGGGLRPSPSRINSYSDIGNNIANKRKKKQKCVCKDIDEYDDSENMIESDPMATGYVPMYPPPEMKATKVLKSAGIVVPPSGQSGERRCLVYESPTTIVKSESDEVDSVPLIRDYVNANGQRIVVPIPSSSNYDPLNNYNNQFRSNQFNGGQQSRNNQMIPVPSMARNGNQDGITESKVTFLL